MDTASTALVIILLLVLADLVLIPVLFFKNRKTKRQLDTAEQKIRELEQELIDLEPYKKVKDTEAEAARMMAEATADIERRTAELQEKVSSTIHEAKMNGSKIVTEARRMSEQMLSEAKTAKEDAERQSKEELSEARQKAKSMRERGQAALDEASEQSLKIINDAKARAEEIAGEALAAKGKADQYEKAAKAMKNVINGYGDEYVIPSRSVLDDLAEDFSHKEAGQELKRLRSHVKTMVKNGLAAECDYVEPNRKTFAIQFVLDAFNGKVDTALSKVKHDNYGKIKQEILDAFNLVNHNGAAFRDARIRKPYLDARLEELKWAVAVNQLQLQEREEQRRIREEIREEEKARREYEKAIREAEKEERMLQKAMQKARKELEAASEEQKLELEQQIAELQEKLQEAESKEARALSMAQQTRRGHVYVISNIGSFGENVYKVGLTRRLVPQDRVRELGDASVPFPFDVHAMIFSEDAPSLETELHHRFQDSQMNKVNPRKEFFRFGIKDIKSTVDDLGIEAHWTMKAEAQEYRETLAIEQAQEQGSEQESRAQAG